MRAELASLYAPFPPDLDGLRAVLFDDGSMMLAMGASALHFDAKQASTQAAFLATCTRRPAEAAGRS